MEKFCVLLLQMSLALINVELTVIQYDNPLGTSYSGDNTKGDRKCCDVGGNSCSTGNDTCDVYFLFCIGEESDNPNNPGCNGCSLDMSQNISENVYSIRTGQNSGLKRFGNLTQWAVNQTKILVQVLDIDELSSGNRDPTLVPDLIDKFSQPLTFQPSPDYWSSEKHVIHLQHYVSLDLQLRVWCADNWVGDSCNISCIHDNYHTCSAPNGILEPFLECSDSDMLVLEMLVPIQKIGAPALLQEKLFGFLSDFVCPKTASNVTLVLDDVRSMGLSQTNVLFHCYCDSHMVSRLKFEETVYVLSVIQSRFDSPSQMFGVPVKTPAPKYIASDQSKAQILVQIRTVFYENAASRGHCGNNRLSNSFCNPRLVFTFASNPGVTGYATTNSADKFVDCNGGLVNIENDHINSSLVKNSTQLFVLHYYPEIIKILVTDLINNTQQLARMGLLMNLTTVGANFLDAFPHVYSGTQNNISLSVEVMAWCSNCYYGDKCQYYSSNCNRSKTVVPPNCHNSNECVNGVCVNSECVCDGWTGPRCNIYLNECDLGFCQYAESCNNTPGNYSCICSTGYTGKNCDMDIDECQLHPCGGNSVCLNTYGSYVCICSNGTQGENCYTEACNSDPCMNNGTCSDNMDGTFNCTCPEGWSGDLCDININECEDTSVCQNGGTCQDTNGTFYCVCISSFTGPHCELDVDECEENKCVNKGTCVNVFGGFDCLCPPQWTGPTCSDDLDECLNDTNACENGLCRNSNGSFDCLCYRGWNGVNCSMDIDECHFEKDPPCFNGGTCSNTVGSYMCSCPQAWTGQHCNTDIDECAEDLRACSLNGNCTNTIGGYNCTCATGWSGEKCDNDVDECVSNNPCKNNGQCDNNKGGYSCNCPSNWTGLNCETDVDECTTNPCNNSGSCLNTPGSFNCLCPSAYTGYVCNTDVNECLTELNLCANNGSCVNNVGGYTCVCPSQWSGPYCKNDIDECSVFMPCMHSGRCVNTVGGYSCICPSSWNGQNCTDNVNECTLYSGICENGGTCSDTVGSYRCSCASGYTGKNCSSDINECENLNTCKHHGQCTNSFGTFHCNCPSSWTGPTCDFDIDECQDALICSNHGNCANVPGSFSCQCNAGWSGGNCSADVNECGQNPCLRGTCTNTPGSYTCVCDPGWKGDHCDINIDECQGIDCSKHGTCTDLLDGFHCKCDYGFTGNQCEIDNNECAGNPCLHNGVCTDYAGYYQCACPAGWNGTDCENDIDECIKNPCRTTERCINTQGSFQCKPVHFDQPSTTARTKTTIITAKTTKTTTQTTQAKTHSTQTAVQGNSEEQKSALPLVPIAGGAGGVVVLLIAIIIVIVVLKRRRKKIDEKLQFDNVEIDEIEDMDGKATITIGNPIYNTLYPEQTSA